MKRAIVTVTPEWLVEALQMPEGTRITNAGWDVLTNAVALNVESEAFADVPDTHRAPHVTWAVESRWRL